MEYMGDKEYWENKFELRGNNLLAPEQALVENITYLKNGSVLDIACGDGRNSLYLLEQGFRVTGIDFSETALNRLQNFATDNKYEITTKQVDLTSVDPLEGLDKFDNVIVNHYRINPAKFDIIIKHMKEDAILFICGFGEKHKVDSKIRSEDLILKSHFDSIKSKVQLLKHEEWEDERGDFVMYIFKKLETFLF